ncbi:lipoprotein [Mesoplasma florum]|nr:lipoprotein [Mesoplasma florum]
MKKLIVIFGAVGFVATSATNVISFGLTHKNDNS